LTTTALNRPPLPQSNSSAISFYAADADGEPGSHYPAVVGAEKPVSVKRSKAS